MKKILIIALSLLTLTFAANAQSKKDVKISEVKFTVTNLDCDNCKQKIEKNIPFDKGIKDVVVSLSDKTVVVKYDNTKTDVEKIQASLKKIGFEAEVAKDVAAAKTASGCCPKASSGCPKASAGSSCQK